MHDQGAAFEAIDLREAGWLSNRILILMFRALRGGHRRLLANRPIIDACDHVLFC